MKKLLYIIAILTICAVLQLLSSCKKETSTPLSGTYDGKLTAVGVQGVKNYDVELKFVGNQFFLQRNFANAGTYKMTGKDQLVFVKNQTSLMPVYAEDFDANLILNGDYTYETKGDSVIFTRNLKITPAVYPGISYQYRLKRIK